MRESHQIDVYLNEPQIFKFRKGQSFQLTISQLQAHKGKHKVDIHFEKKHTKNY